MSGLKLSSVTKSFDETKVIHGVDIEVEQGELCVFVGPSGCGKSTLLRLIAGLERVSSGAIEIEGRDVTHREPSDRSIAMVFQSYALYPHMTVAQNIGFGLELSGVPRAQIRKKVAEAAEILRLTDLLDRRPKALSGGQRQRVAIGRAIVRDPKVFLLDEPLSNLDAELRAEMRVEIARLHAEIGATMIYVTHDQVEAMTLADRIVALKDGFVEQIGRPMDLYEQPQTRFVAGFIGSPKMNFVAGAALGRSQAATVGVRPEHLSVAGQGDWPATIRLIERLGAETLLHLEVEGLGPMVARCDPARLDPLAQGDRVFVSFGESQLHAFDDAGNRL